MHRLKREAEVAAAWVAERIQADFEDLAPQLFTGASPTLRRYFERLSDRTPPLPLSVISLILRLLILDRLVLLDPWVESYEFDFLGREPGVGVGFSHERQYRVRIEPGRISTRDQGEDLWSTLHDETPGD